MREAVQPDVSEIEALSGISTGDRVSEFVTKIPPNFVRAMRDAADPMALARQVLPDNRERIHGPDESSDPVGDLAAEVTPGLIHKYHGRALLIVTGACAIHCRYCFRREFPYGDSALRPTQQAAALNYLRTHPDIREIILSGGDPLSVSTRRLRDLVSDLARIPSLVRLRIHSRIPVVLPERIDHECLQALSEHALQKVLVIHANHADEINIDAQMALHQLRETGWTLLNQAVLLKGVNDSIAAQVRLAERCMEVGVLPYYLHVLDRVRGSGHLFVADSKAIDLMHSIRQQLPGYLVPRLVRESQGAPYKVPIL